MFAMPLDWQTSLELQKLTDASPKFNARAAEFKPLRPD